MDFNKLNNNGFIHFKNAINIDKLHLFLNYIKSIDFNTNNIKYNTVNNKNINYMSLKKCLSGINTNVTCNKKDVIQLYSSNPFPFNKYLLFQEQKKLPREYQTPYKISYEHKTFIENFYNNNYNFIYSLFQTSTIHNLIHKYSIYSIKYFINKPGCYEQEIHCDDPINKFIICIIPLNYNLDGGTTSMYDNNIVNKFKNVNDIKSLFNIGFLYNLPDEKKKIFFKARYKTIFNIGDILIFNSDTFHNGTKNNSYVNREFLYILMKHI